MTPQHPTKKENHMQDRTRLILIAGGSYLAGRTKKGKLALQTVMFLSGNNTGPQVLNVTRDGVLSVVRSEQGKMIVSQVTGPLADAAQRAAIAMVMSRVQGLSDTLASRTEALQSGAETVTGVADDVTGAAAKSGKSLKDRLPFRGKDESASEESEDESPEEMGQDEPEPDEDSDEAPGQDDEDDEEDDEPDEEGESDLEEPEPEPEPEPEAPKARKPRTAKKAASDG